MYRVATVLATAALAVCIGRAAPGEGKSGLDDEGFITTWLLLAPIPLQENQSGADALGIEHLLFVAQHVRPFQCPVVRELRPQQQIVDQFRAFVRRSVGQKIARLVSRRQ